MPPIPDIIPPPADGVYYCMTGGLYYCIGAGLGAVVAPLDGLPPKNPLLPLLPLLDLPPPELPTKKV